MATRTAYRVIRSGFAPRKGGGDVYLTRQNEDQIPDLLTQSAIKERVDSGALEEYEIPLDETRPEDLVAAGQLEAEAGVKPRSGKKKKAS